MTLDLDEDAELAILGFLENEPDRSLEQIVNELLRIGLSDQLADND